MDDNWKIDYHDATALWDAVNKYAEACGGDTGRKTIGDARMNAVVEVDRAVRGIANRRVTAVRDSSYASPFAPGLC